MQRNWTINGSAPWKRQSRATNPRTDKTVRTTGLSCIQYPTGIAPRSSITGSVARVNTTASSGQPKLRNFPANFRPKLDALMESTVAFASPEAANQTRDREAHIAAHTRNLRGRGSSNREGRISSGSSEKSRPTAEALLWEEGKWGLNKRGRVTEQENGEFEGRAWLEAADVKVLSGRRGVRECFLRWVLLVAENVRATDKEAAIEGERAN